MIIYDKRKPKTFDGANCVGITGENLAETQEFLIRGMCDITVDYTIHLRFADGSVNSVIPDSTAIDETGTKLVWKVRKNDIFMHGYFELQLEGRGENGYVFQTQIVTLYADESIPIEDKEYLNPNSETLKLREETTKLLDETKLCRTEIDKTKKLIEQSDITKKEDNSNKVSSKRDITDSSTNYPSVKYLNDFYYDANETYSLEETDELLGNKADKATTLAGYGITDAYTQEEIQKRLGRKLDSKPFDSEPKPNSPCYLTSGAVYKAMQTKADVNSVYSKTETDDSLAEKADKVDVDTSLANKANLVSSSNIFDFDAWAKGLQSLTNPVYKGTLDKVDYTEKSLAFTFAESGGQTNSWTSSAPQSMRIAVKPNTKYLFSWSPSSTNCGAYVFLNGINTTSTRFHLKKSFGSFTTAEDTTYIFIRFDYDGTGFFKVSEIMITEKESFYLPNKVAEGVPEVANEVLAFEKATQTSLDGKYDSSNVELGTATLTPYSTVSDKIKSATCLYEKIGDIVIVNVTVIMNATSLSGTATIALLNMPFSNKSDVIVHDIGISKNGGMFRGSVNKSAWLQFTPLNKQAYNFVADEQVNFSLIYKI